MGAATEGDDPADVPARPTPVVRVAVDREHRIDPLQILLHRRNTNLPSIRDAVDAERPVNDQNRDACGDVRHSSVYYCNPTMSGSQPRRALLAQP
jgi:hypothetical protein